MNLFLLSIINIGLGYMCLMNSKIFNLMNLLDYFETHVNTKVTILL